MRLRRALYVAKGFISKKLGDKVASKVSDIPSETMDLCPDCRRKER